MGDFAAVAVWLVLLAYLSAGALFWLWLMIGGLKRLDPAAHAAPLRVKALISPGLIALWPIAVRRLIVRAPEDAL